jgi:hypothetical protein
MSLRLGRDIFKLGSLIVSGGVEQAGSDGPDIPVMRIAFAAVGKHPCRYTTLDSYEALRLKGRIEAWLNGELEADVSDEEAL